MLSAENNRLVFRYDAEQLWIEPWGENALRIRATKQSDMPTEDWALLPPASNVQAEISVGEQEGEASIFNGKIRATISRRGKIMIYNAKGDLLLEEYARNRADVLDPKCSALRVEAREFKPLQGGDYHLTLRLESVSRQEKIFGMGQYQQEFLDLKGLDLELAHRNSQASVPFALSSLGYGLLWNNPAVGRAVLGKNIMTFEALSTKALDYWITAGDEPAEIEEAYANATGKVPMMPEYGLGFWQCKLRYQTQEELLEVAREYKRRGLPLDVIVVDFFHWPLQGDWKFDATYWPDPGEFGRFFCFFFFQNSVIRESHTGRCTWEMTWKTGLDITRKLVEEKKKKTVDGIVRDLECLKEILDCTNTHSPHRRHDQRNQRHGHRGHGLGMALRRLPERKLRGDARERLPDQSRPRVPHRHGFPRQHHPLRSDQSSGAEVRLGQDQGQLLLEGNQDFLAR